MEPEQTSCGILYPIIWQSSMRRKPAQLTTNHPISALQSTLCKLRVTVQQQAALTGLLQLSMQLRRMQLLFTGLEGLQAAILCVICI
jgi:hypothetical protein